MKKTIISIVFFSCFISGWAQESFKKKYKICEDSIRFKGGNFILLKKDIIIKYKDLKEKGLINDSYKIGDKITITEELLVKNIKTNISKEIIIDQKFIDSISLKETKNVMLKSSIFALVSFENDKVIINPYLKKDLNGKYSRESTYYYQLKNRQIIKLPFTEFNVSALIIPIKYRFKGEDFTEEFSTAINGNIFFGYSWGKTSFFYQEKVGNKSNTWKLTGGLLLGASTVTLNSSNTSNANIPLTDSTEIIKGLGSVGFGVTYSFNKINFGAFYGYDYAVGDEAANWNYNKKPWLGIAVGYSLLNF